MRQILEVALGKIATITMGTSPKGETYNTEGIGIPLLNGPTEFGLIHPTCTLFTTDSKKDCNKGDLIFCVRGSTTGRMNWADRQYSLGRGVCSIRGATPMDTKYIRYCIELKLGALLKLSGGATFPNLTGNDLSTFSIPYQPHRHKIAAILSAYDDLIENNTQRIKILEEMAQALYREWFVNFRFPGHEKVRMMESELGMVPEGWEVKPIGEVIETIGGGTPSTKIPEYWENGDIIWFTPSDLTSSGTMFISESSKRITQSGFKNSSARLFPSYSVMMTSRATIGVTAINTKEACTNQGFITCIPNEHLSTYQIYFWIEQNKDKIIAVASGATYKEINRTEFRQFLITVPDRDINKRFVQIITPIAKQIENLQVKNANLHRTRDLLLPKLISGEVDVQNIDMRISSKISGEA